jgi:hypothetical protein
MSVSFYSEQFQPPFVHNLAGEKNTPSITETVICSIAFLAIGMMVLIFTPLDAPVFGLLFCAPFLMSPKTEVIQKRSFSILQQAAAK